MSGTENRKSVRHDIDLVVELEFADESTIRCYLADVSQGGARLKVREPDSLPDQFMLQMSGRVRRYCRVVWRSSDQVGIEFLAAPQPLSSRASRNPVLIKCPKTGKNIPTGLLLTVPDDLAKITSVRRFTQCSWCKHVHGWTPKEAFLQVAPTTTDA
ncbi:MAG TPA: PilZ domain-containing protein [Xanthobacteraceae bacterium]|nr:PilZ domain-containing protein [Xanthobacteraceae bacterium]